MGKKDADDPLATIFEWLKDFKANLVEEVFAPAHSSRESALEPFCGSGNKIKKAPYFHSLPERAKLRRLLENQNDKGSLQKTHWRSSFSRRRER